MFHNHGQNPDLMTIAWMLISSESPDPNFDLPLIMIIRITSHRANLSWWGLDETYRFAHIEARAPKQKYEEKYIITCSELNWIIMNIHTQKCEYKYFLMKI